MSKPDLFPPRNRCTTSGSASVHLRRRGGRRGQLLLAADPRPRGPHMPPAGNGSDICLPVAAGETRELWPALQGKGCAVYPETHMDGRVRRERCGQMTQGGPQGKVVQAGDPCVLWPGIPIGQGWAACRSDMRVPAAPRAEGDCSPAPGESPSMLTLTWRFWPHRTEGLCLPHPTTSVCSQYQPTGGPPAPVPTRPSTCRRPDTPTPTPCQAARTPACLTGRFISRITGFIKSAGDELRLAPVTAS